MSIKNIILIFAFLSLASSAQASGQQVSKPLIDHSAQVTQQVGETEIDINKAEAETFESIKGIGPKMAQRIVAYRQENGSFESINDLTKVKGIGEKKLEKIRKYLTV